MTTTLERFADDGTYLYTDRFGGTWFIKPTSNPDCPFLIVPKDRSEAWKRLKGPHCTINHEGPCNSACGDY
jgi:hypothetical protein